MTSRLLTVLLGGFVTISAFLPGSGLRHPRASIDTIVPEQVMDTTEIKRIVEQRINKMVKEQVDTIDSIRHRLLDTIQEGKRVGRIRKYVDVERRSDGSIYTWNWWFVIIRYIGYTDTLFDRVDIIKIR